MEPSWCAPSTGSPLASSSVYQPSGSYLGTSVHQIGHHIPHRFSGTVRIPTTCNVCEKPLFFGYKCRDCKYYCHTDCVRVAPNSCGLSEALFQVFRQRIDASLHSSAASAHLESRLHSSTQFSTTLHSSNSTFWVSVEDTEGRQEESMTTAKTPVSTAPATNTAIAQANGVTEGRPKSLISREWNIPFDDLILKRELPGTRRCGAVYRGTWHGSVAIRLLSTSTRALGNVRQEMAQFESFRRAVATYRKIRHDNLVLFMGASAKPPHQFAIVTALCSGLSLHQHLHLRQDRFSLHRIVALCRQIFQGMGYLHARAIVHKDLRTKNIFVENGKIVITDYVSDGRWTFVTDTPDSAGLRLPPGYLSYLAPEILSVLRLTSSWSVVPQSLPYSNATDVYAFGTVFYELLQGNWPFAGKPSELIIWQVGRGIKQPLSNCKASKEVKDLLLHCWAYNAADRPDFGKDLPERFSRLPKHMQRAPSHPVQLNQQSNSSDFDVL